MIRQQLEVNPGLWAKTLFEELQREHPGEFADGQRRTLQRRIPRWRALGSPDAGGLFPAAACAGTAGLSEFTRMNELGITVAGQTFVLTYSNWEAP